MTNNEALSIFDRIESKVRADGIRGMAIAGEVTRRMQSWNLARDVSDWATMARLTGEDVGTN